MKIATIAPLVTAIRVPQRGGAQSPVADLAATLHRAHGQLYRRLRADTIPAAVDG